MFQLIGGSVLVVSADDRKCPVCGRPMTREQTLMVDYSSTAARWRVVKDEYTCGACRQLKRILSESGDL